MSVCEHTLDLTRVRHNMHQYTPSRVLLYTLRQLTASSRPTGGVAGDQREPGELPHGTRGESVKLYTELRIQKTVKP